MKVLVTGAKGFIGKNLILALKSSGYNNVFEYDIDTDFELLHRYCLECDFVFHLAGVNRPQNTEEFTTGNVDLTQSLLGFLKNNPGKPSVMYASSTQAELDNPYGISKRQAEDLVFDYAKQTGAKAYVYRFPNVFGKWCRPNYNSAVATFCHNAANDLPLVINDGSVIMHLVYIDDLVAEMLAALGSKECKDGKFCYVPVTHKEKLGVIADIISSFPRCRGELLVPNQSDPLTRKLYATYLSYLPKEKLKYPLNMHSDNRGSFTEFIRTPERGQFSVNVIMPGVIKGNHRHNTKNEKFLTVFGSGVVRLRLPGSSDIIEIETSGNRLEVVDIPPGYTHNIENTGNTEMVTLMWVNEPYDPDNQDTYYLEV